MLKLISKFVLNVFPSVAASVIGGYIVHNYIYARPAAPAVTASTPARTADTAGTGGVPFAVPVPVIEKTVATEMPAASPQRPISSQSVRGPARAAGERFNIAHRGGHADVMAPQREYAAARGVVPMPAIELAADAKRAEPPAGPPIDLLAASARPGPGRLIPAVTEFPLVRRLSALSADVETMLVSQTLSVADGVATTAKSVLTALSPR